MNSSEEKIYRNIKNCQERWNTHLIPDIRRNQWTIDEDYALISIIIKFEGVPKWKLVTSKIKGRTINACKNRLDTILKKIYHKNESF